MEKDKTIGVFSTFYDLDPGYSLCSVVIDQLRALTKNGCKTILFVLPTFKDDAQVPAGVEIRKIVPQIILEPYKGTSYPSHWKEDVKKCKDMFEKNLQDIDYLICHDIFFIDTFLPYNIALRESNLTCQFLAWTHSAPSNRPTLVDNPHANRYTLPPRTKLVYLNHDKANDLAEMYGAWLKDVRIVHNARDPRTFWDLDPLVNRLIDKYDLFSADIISVYPLSTPRMVSGKGLDKVIKILTTSSLEQIMKLAINKTEVLNRRFRHCATRALMILRQYKGKKKRVGRQQVSSMILMAAVKRISNDFAILKEARREVLEDLMDINNAKVIVGAIKESKIKVEEIQTNVPSPFAFNLVVMGYTDILKIEEKIEFLKRMHQMVMAKIALKK